MAAGFDGQGTLDALGIETDGLVNHVAVAPLVAVMLPAPVVDELLQARGGHRIGHDGLSGLFIQQNGGNQRNKPVAVDFPAIRVHDGGAVAVRVENDAQVCPRVQHGLAQRRHCLRVFRVRDVVGEVSVRLQELAALHPCAQAFQQPGIEAACAVARVHHHMQAQQRLGHVGFKAPADTRCQQLLIGGQERLLRDGPGYGHSFGLQLLRRAQQALHIAALQAALLHKELQAILVKGMVAGGNHNGAVRLKAGGNNAHIHGGGGAHAEIHHRRAGLRHALGGGMQQLLTGDAAVAPQGDGHLRDTPVLLFRNKAGKGHAQAGCHMGCQGAVFTHSHAAHIAAAFKFHPIHCSLPPSLVSPGCFQPAHRHKCPSAAGTAAPWPGSPATRAPAAFRQRPIRTSHPPC